MNPRLLIVLAVLGSLAVGAWSVRLVTQARRDARARADYEAYARSFQASDPVWSRLADGRYRGQAGVGDERLAVEITVAGRRMKDIAITHPDGKRAVAYQDAVRLALERQSIVGLAEASPAERTLAMAVQHALAYGRPDRK